ncbi:MAG: hypothetical protein GY928_14780 [Colwellia sp.]|nr:hypothetical protein [Colwellia sp.]
MFEALRESHEQIIASKKAKIYNCDPGGDEKCSIKLKSIDPGKLTTQVKGLEIDDAYYYLAVNTTKVLDSHRDMHQNGIWNKTAKDQKGKVYLVWDHELKGGSTIVKKEDIQLLVAEVPFSALGQSYQGNTEALIYKFRKDKIIDLKAKEWLESGDEIQASVRMQYVQMLFALDSKEADDKEFKKNYDKYYPEIANKDDFEGIEYFWPVLEAKNVLESSLVLFGSNHATGIVQEDSKVQPSKGTGKKDNEPSLDTQLEFYKQFNS